MARAYSPKALLRHTANELVARYFRGRNLLTEVDFDGRREADIDDVFEAWQALPSDDRLAIDSEFRDIRAMAHDAAVQTLIDEARFHDEDLEPLFADLDGPYDKAMLAFLDYRTVFDVATRFNDADGRPQRYWRSARRLPRVSPADDAVATRRLGQALIEYLRGQGRGYACVVEVFRRDDRLYYFAYPEDYGATHMEFAGGELERRKLRPAFEIIFVYKQNAGTLDIFYEGSREHIVDLRRIFVAAILGQSADALVGDDRVFQLNELKRRDVRFVFDPSSGITDVRVKKLRLSARSGSKRRWTLDADPRTDRYALYQMLDETFASEGERISSVSPKIRLSLLNVTQVGLVVEFRADGKRRATQTFDISYPNACPLGHDGRDGAIRRMLVDSGIESESAGEDFARSA